MDLFSVPLGYVGPNQGPDDELSPPSIPAEVFDHRGKWIALRGGQIVTIKDTAQDLYDEFDDQTAGVLIFHVPTTRIYAL